MEIVAAVPWFLAAVTVLGYCPGRLVLERFNPALSPLEDLTLSLVFGLLVSGCVYWLVAYCGGAHYYFLWPLAVAACFVFTRRKHFRGLLASRPGGVASGPPAARKSKWQRQHTALAAVIALGVLMLSVLPQYYGNLTFDSAGGLKRADDFPDAVLHVAIASELTHTVPPQAPVLAGRALSYHYGMDLTVAMFARATGLNTRDLTLRFVATLLLVLAMLATFCFSRAWLGSGGFGALVAFLVFFGDDFSFIPGLLLGWEGRWSLAFDVPAVFSLFFVNPMTPGVGLLFTGLYCALRYVRDGGRAWLLMSALVMMGLAATKVFTAAHYLASLGIAAVVYLALFRDSRVFRLCALAAALASPVLLGALSHNDQGAQILVSLDPWPYVSNAMRHLGLGDSYTAGIPGFIFVALPIYLVGCLGLRVIALPGMARELANPSRDGGLRFTLAVFVVIGIALTLTLRVVPREIEDPSNNSGWFLIHGKYVAWVFVAEVLQRLHRRLVARGFAPGRAGAAIAIAAAALAVPSTFQHFANQLAPGMTVYGRDAVETAGFLARHSRPGDVVLAGQGLLDPVLTLTKCRVPYGYFDDYLASASDVRQRRATAAEFALAWARGEVRTDLLRELGVDYLAVPRGQSRLSAGLPPELALVYGNTGYVVFRVQRVP